MDNFRRAKSIDLLRKKFSIDGLHPDLRGKMFIGQAIEKDLREKYFNFITEVKEW